MHALLGIQQQIDAWSAGLHWPGEALLRLGLACAAGGLVGLEREIRVRHAGFRTMLLVCLGSALVMLVSIRLPFAVWPQLDGDNRVVVDPGRIAYGIMTGVGFLGAGTIIERRGKARGLTTAAAIWCVAAIGMSLGFGMYELGAVATALVLLTLWLLDHLEDVLPVRRLREVTLRTSARPGVLQEMVDLFESRGYSVQSTARRRHHQNDDLVEVTLHLLYSARRDYLAFESELERNQPDLDVVSSREI